MWEHTPAHTQLAGGPLSSLDRRTSRIVLLSHQPTTARDETSQDFQACGEHRLQHLSPAAQLVSAQPVGQSLTIISNPMLHVAPSRGVAVPGL